MDAQRKRLIACSAIDNLLKGAAGQAVQCMNIRFGLDERLGLDAGADASAAASAAAAGIDSASLAGSR